MKIWLVDFPTHQYKENVKELAREKRLKIIDSRFAAGYKKDDVESKPPKLTKIAKVKAESEAKVKAEASKKG